MSLTTTDLNEIRSVIESALTKQTKEIIRPIQDELQGLRNDIKEIYDMISDLRSTIPSNKLFQKLSVEQKLLKLNAELLYAAKQAGITLPR
ncbi:hypothetical protein BH10PAT3_BH10PAT3_0560 [soil metagenome]